MRRNLNRKWVDAGAGNRVGDGIGNRVRKQNREQSRGQSEEQNRKQSRRQNRSLDGNRNGKRCGRLFRAPDRKTSGSLHKKSHRAACGAPRSPREQERINWIRDLTLKEDCQEEWSRYEKKKKRVVLLCLSCGLGLSAVALAGVNRVVAYRIAGLTALLCLLFPMALDSHLKDEVKKRQEQMEEDYPVILLKLSLFLEAGMSLRRAWEAVVSGYMQEERKGMRYAYEEMGLTLSDIQNGHAESRAYGEFGRRCKSYSYMKLGCLLCPISEKIFDYLFISS